MNLLFCGDAGVLDGLKIALASIVQFNREPISVYMLTLGMSYEDKTYKALTKEEIAGMEEYIKEVNPDSFIKLMDVTDLFNRFVPRVNMNTRFTPMCMLRLLADQVEEIPDKVLYLDTDVIAKGDINEIYQQSMDDYEIAGVLDYYGSWFFRKNPLRRDYLNSGVLLMNMAKIKETGLLGKCRERCQNKKMFMPDQSALNKVARYKKKLPRRYNDQRRTHKDTLIRHFTTTFRYFPKVKTVTVKPWELDRVHTVLKTNEYDWIIQEGLKID